MHVMIMLTKVEKVERNSKIFFVLLNSYDYNKSDMKLLTEIVAANDGVMTINHWFVCSCVLNNKFILLCYLIQDLHHRN